MSSPGTPPQAGQGGQSGQLDPGAALDPGAGSRQAHGAALTLGLGFATATALLLTQGAVGFVRDEGYYFTAAQSYEEWLRLLVHAPLQALSSTERYWSYNFEHPGLTKLLFALSHLVFSTWLRVLPDALAWRLPAFVFGGLLTHYLATLGLARSRTAAVLAPLLFWCTERTFFHGHLACFDLPICAMTAGVAVAWARALGVLEPGSLGRLAKSSGPVAATARSSLFGQLTKSGGHRAGLASPAAALPAAALPAAAPLVAAWAPGPSAAASRLGGPSLAAGLGLAFLYGCALAVKHNAWFLPPVLLVHGLFLKAPLRRRALLTLPFLLLSPLVLFAFWPLLWHDPIRHLGDWIAFHLHHVHYAWYYLGNELRAPPFPHEYPLVVVALALPLPTALLLFTSGGSLVLSFLRRRIEPLRLLELALAGGALLPFLTGDTPIFGGLKHWLGFLALLTPEAASLLERAARSAAASNLVSWPRAVALASAATLLPGLWQIAHLHPYGTSAYGELAGDLPGAASLGMQRQYWSNNVTAVLPWLNANAPNGARIFFHEVNAESVRAYQQSGQLRKDLRQADGPGDADYAALQWHREFRDREPETWNAFRTRRPATGLYLDETPQIIVYARPGLPGAP